MDLVFTADWEYYSELVDAKALLQLGDELERNGQDILATLPAGYWDGIRIKGDLYGVPTRVDFYHFIRPEVKFDSYDALADQIRRDADAAEAYFSAHPLKRVSEGKENSSICR